MIGEKVLVQLHFCSIFLFNSCCSEVDVQATDHGQSGVISRFLSDFNSGPAKEHLPDWKVQGSSPGGCLIIFYDLLFSHHF